MYTWLLPARQGQAPLSRANTWDALHPQILHASRDIAKAGKFDDAIFAAFRFVEAEIQNRIGSAGIGANLLDEAFDGVSPKIDISPDPTRPSGDEAIVLRCVRQCSEMTAGTRKRHSLHANQR